MAENKQEASGMKEYHRNLRAKIENADSSCLGKVIRGLNIASALFIAAAGVIVFFNSPSFAQIICAIYVILFGFMIVFAELRFERTLPFIARNFGFLFNWVGRAMFLLFIGSLALGLDNVGLAAGIITYIVIIFNTYILCANKDVTAKLGEKNPNLEYKPQDAANVAYGVAKGAVDFAKENPEAAHRAVDIAASNPEATGRLVGAVSGDPRMGSAAVMAASNSSYAHAAVDANANANARRG